MTGLGGSLLSLVALAAGGQRAMQERRAAREEEWMTLSACALSPLFWLWGDLLGLLSLNHGWRYACCCTASALQSLSRCLCSQSHTILALLLVQHDQCHQHHCRLFHVSLSRNGWGAGGFHLSHPFLPPSILPAPSPYITPPTYTPQATGEPPSRWLAFVHLSAESALTVRATLLLIWTVMSVFLCWGVGQSSAGCADRNDVRWIQS